MSGGAEPAGRGRGGAGGLALVSRQHQHGQVETPAQALPTRASPQERRGMEESEAHTQHTQYQACFTLQPQTHTHTHSTLEHTVSGVPTRRAPIPTAASPQAHMHMRVHTHAQHSLLLQPQDHPNPENACEPLHVREQEQAAERLPRRALRRASLPEGFSTGGLGSCACLRQERQDPASPQVSRGSPLRSCWLPILAKTQPHP